jgi:F-type H+-transporting ATPase subunit b
MEQTLQALGGLMVQAIFTIICLIFLYYYLKVMLFGPLEKVLKQRGELTEGARKGAEASLADAERKQRQYEITFNEARAGVYRAQEDTRRKWLEDQTAAVAAAKSAAEEQVRMAKEQIAADSATARQNLTATSGAMADEIATVMLARKAAA